MATPTPTLHIKSAARKLPIKRKPSSDPNPTSTPSQDSLALVPKPEDDVPLAAIPPDNGYDDEDDDDAEDDDESEYGLAASAAGVEGGPGGAAAAGDLCSPPFKFHQIWSESDEIHFLKGLLGCWSQGMVFPCDLSLFNDGFSKSMPQPTLDPNSPRSSVASARSSASCPTALLMAKTLPASLPMTMISSTFAPVSGTLPMPPPLPPLPPMPSPPAAQATSTATPTPRPHLVVPVPRDPLPLSSPSLPSPAPFPPNQCL